jgi:hypothetical protein
MLESLFGGKNIEKILFFLLVNQSCYGGQLARTFQQALSPIQKALDRLENGGIIVSFLMGKTRIYQFNPRYPFLQELKSLLKKAYTFIPQDFKNNYYEPKIRKRPRKKGKPQ